MVKIPYDKQHEQKARRDFENNTYGKYPSNPQPIYEEKASASCLDDINHQIDTELVLKRLSQRQRAILKAVLAGFNQQEIAIQLKVNQATISREMHKIRKTSEQVFDF